MSAGLETMTVQEWIVARLSGDATLVDLTDRPGDPGSPERLLDRIWEGEYRGSEQETPWWISFTVPSSVDVKGVGLIQVMATVLFQTKVVCRGDDYTPGVAVYKRVHDLLESQTNQATTDGLVLECGRVSTFQFPERTSGMEYRHLGGQYLARAQ